MADCPVKQVAVTDGRSTVDAIREIARDSLFFMGFVYIAIAVGPTFLGGEAIVDPWGPVGIVGLVAAYWVTRRCIHGIASRRSTSEGRALTRVESVVRSAWPEAACIILVFGGLFIILSFFGSNIPPVTWVWLVGMAVLLSLIHGTIEMLRREKLTRHT